MMHWSGSGTGSWLLAAAMIVLSAPLQAAGLSYAADMVQRGPQGIVSTGKLYVSGDKRRIEVSRAGDTLVSITDSERGVAFTLFPARRSYTEQQTALDISLSGVPADPCAGNPQAQCRNLGPEQVAGRTADKWEIRYQQQGMLLTAYQWIDQDRHITLRQEMPGGQRSELRFVGSEQLNGREVEKWEMVNSEANKAPIRTFQWYDAELQQAIKQELPGGYVSELNNIQVGDLDEKLFQVPEGYRPLAMSPPPPQTAQ